jgi:hypothetical protein
MLESLATGRHGLDPQDGGLIEQLTQTRSQLATLVLGGPPTTDMLHDSGTIQSLQKQMDTLEADLSRHSAAFRVQSQPVTIAAVQTAPHPRQHSLNLCVIHLSVLREAFCPATLCRIRPARPRRAVMDQSWRGARD